MVEATLNSMSYGVKTGREREIVSYLFPPFIRMFPNSLTVMFMIMILGRTNVWCLGTVAQTRRNRMSRSVLVLSHRVMD